MALPACSHTSHLSEPCHACCNAQLRACLLQVLVQFLWFFASSVLHTYELPYLLFCRRFFEAPDLSSARPPARVLTCALPQSCSFPTADGKKLLLTRFCHTYHTPGQKSKGGPL